MNVEQRVGPDVGRPDSENAAGRGAGAGARLKFVPNRQLGLREQVREVMRFFHYSPRTEETYWHWVERFLRFHRPLLVGAGGQKEWGWRAPETMGAPEVAAFLSDLATRGGVAAATQNQAFHPVR